MWYNWCVLSGSVAAELAGASGQDVGHICPGAGSYLAPHPPADVDVTSGSCPVLSCVDCAGPDA